VSSIDARRSLTLGQMLLLKNLAVVSLVFQVSVGSINLFIVLLKKTDYNPLSYQANIYVQASHEKKKLMVSIYQVYLLFSTTKKPENLPKKVKVKVSIIKNMMWLFSKNLLMEKKIRMNWLNKSAAINFIVLRRMHFKEGNRNLSKII